MHSNSQFHHSGPQAHTHTRTHKYTYGRAQHFTFWMPGSPSYDALKMKVLVVQSCLTFCDPMDYSLPGSSVHRILQARIPEWVAIPFSRGLSQTRDWTHVSHSTGRFFTVWATREALCPRNQQISCLASQPSQEVWAFSCHCHSLCHIHSTFKLLSSYFYLSRTTFFNIEYLDV